jgi:uncharacterized phage protein (TIGR01671 family)
MREIKFRAWDKGRFHGPEESVVDAKTKEPVTWTTPARMLYLFNSVCHGELNVLDFSWLDQWDKDRYVLMQYTGLKDTNGKEIYEGDICKGEYWGKCVIEFGMGGEGEPADHVGSYCGWCYRELPSRLNECTGFTGCDLEIIGNIYENKELLKEEK